MGDIYRVAIIRENNDGEQFESETLFEVAGGIGLVARVAPGALSDALRAEVEDVPAALPQRSLADRVFDSAVAGEQVPGPVVNEPAKRKRRTKAEILADEAAVAAGFRDAAHRAEVEAQQQVAQQDAAPVMPEPAAPVPPAAPENVPAEAVPAAPAPAEPYNPFAVK